MTRTIKGSIKLEPQSTAPTAGKGVMYYDSDDDKLKVCQDNSTFDEVISGVAIETTVTDDDTKIPSSGAVVDYVTPLINTTTAPLGVAQAQNYFETLKHSGDVDNEDYMIADIFTDADGLKNTIVTGDSSATYDATNDLYVCNIINTDAATDTTHDPNSVNNPSYAFDTSTTTYADDDIVHDVEDTDTNNPGITKYLGKTFSSRYVTKVSLKARGYANDVYNSGDDSQVIIKLQKYKDSTWTDVTTIGDSGYVHAGTVDTSGIYTVNDTCEGLRVSFFIRSSSGGDNWDIHRRLYYLWYSHSSSDIETTTIYTCDGTEKGLIVYDKSDKPTGTSVNVDVIYGATTLSTQAVRTFIPITPTAGDVLSLDFNLATTDTSVTPSLYGYGLVIIK